MEPQARRILVVNGKGGCGKTTIATNLAVAYATNGMPVALADHDPQASSTYWSEQRPLDLPPVPVVRAHELSSMYQTQVFHNRMPPDTRRIVVDGQSNARDGDLGALLSQADIVLIPVLPSSIDIRASGNFITKLLTHRAFRAHPIPVGVIANRVQPNSPTHTKLMHFLGCLDLPTVATFRDSPVYSDAIELGQGVVDLKDVRSARKETAAWHKLLRWLEQLVPTHRATVQSIRQRPALAAMRHDEVLEERDAG
jgi:chromosome partitioning protein